MYLALPEIVAINKELGPGNLMDKYECKWTVRHSELLIQESLPKWVLKRLQKVS